MNLTTTVRPERHQHGTAAIFHPDGRLTTMALSVVPAHSPYQAGDWIEYHAGIRESAPRTRYCFTGYVLGGMGSTLLRGLTDSGREWVEHWGALRPVGVDRPELCASCPRPRKTRGVPTREPAAEQLQLFDTPDPVAPAVELYLAGGITFDQLAARLTAAGVIKRGRFLAACSVKGGATVAHDESNIQEAATVSTDEADPFGYEAEARAADDDLAERMRTDYPHRRQVLATAAGKDPGDMTREEFAAWCAERADIAADNYGDDQVTHYVDRMTELDLAGALDHADADEL